MADSTAPALKEMFNAARYREIAQAVGAVWPRFDSKKFLALTLPGLDALSLLQRMRRTTEALHATLPENYPAALAILRPLAPTFQGSFVGIVFPDYVARYGLDDFETSMAALKYFTPFSSSEFAVREFLRQDQARTLAVMTQWSCDPDEHVRRLASEGCRPRLPWSFRLTALVVDPSPVIPILENLKADPSLYVRKSVANHLNDISKDHPEWLLDWLTRWDLSQPATAWIAKRAVRSLIKHGHPRAFKLFRFTARPAVQLRAFQLSPARVKIGGHIAFEFSLQSLAPRPQRLAVDFIVHYTKKNGKTSPKVFKLKEITLAAHTTVVLSKGLQLRDLSTRQHYPGRHRVDIMVNGAKVASGEFILA